MTVGALVVTSGHNRREPMHVDDTLNKEHIPYIVSTLSSSTWRSTATTRRI